MSLTATLAMTLAVTEDISSATGGASTTNKTVLLNGYNVSRSLPETSPLTVPATKVASFEQLMTDGSASIDLTDVEGVNGASISGSGLKVQAILVTALSDNENAITISDGSSNGYELLGASWQVILQPGQSFMCDLIEQAPDISGSAKTIDLSGTGAQGIQCIIVMG